MKLTCLGILLLAVALLFSACQKELLLQTDTDAQQHFFDPHFAAANNPHLKNVISSNKTEAIEIDSNFIGSILRDLAHKEEQKDFVV